MFGPPLHTIHCRGGKEDIERMQVQLEVDPLCLESLQLETVVIPNQTYPLHEAARLAHVHCLDFLLKSGARPDIFDCNIQTAISHAMSNFGSVKKDETTIVDTVSVLLKHGASPDYLHALKPRTFYLDTALENDHYKLMQLLLEYGACTGDIVKNEAEGIIHPYKFPLWVTLTKRNLTAFSMLLLHGANVNFADGVSLQVPQAILLKFSSSKPQRVIEALKLFYEHGGSYWTTSLSGESALDFLAMHTDSDDDDSDEEDYVVKKKKIYQGGGALIRKEIENMMQNPRSLQSSCRLIIKKAMGRDYWKNVKELPLPKPTISYLEYSDCELIEPDEDSSDDDSYTDVSDESFFVDSDVDIDIFDIMRQIAPDSDADSDGKDVYYYMKLNREYNPSDSDESW